MARHNLTTADQIFIGAAYYGAANAGQRGLPVTPLYRVRFGAVALAVSNGVSVSQSVGAAGSFTITGSLASGGVATFATPRNVVAAWTGTSILTITGTDQYGRTMSEVSASGTSHTGKKAFKTITAITSSAAITAATVGSGVVLGLPIYAAIGDVFSSMVDNAVDAGTFVPGVTATATTSTGDVRGTYAPSSAPDGTKVFALTIALNDWTTKEGGYGVAQA